VVGVTDVFNNNGAGVRGDSKAAFATALLDSMCRTCGYLDPAANRPDYPQNPGL
jgi:hypothetical protein